MPRRIPILFRILDSFFRHRWLFLISLVVVSSIVMSALYLRSRAFVASALTQVITDNVAAALGETQSNAWISPAQQSVNHFNDLLSDDQPGGFLDTALKDAQLSHPIALDPRADDPRAALLHKKLSAATQSDTLWAISLTWDDPEECQKIVAKLREDYRTQIGQERAAQAVATQSFVESQIREYQKRLQAAEQALITYKQTHSGELPEAESADIGQLSSLKAELDNLEITGHDAALKKQALVARIAQIKPMSILEQTTASQSPLDRAIGFLKAQRLAMLAEGKRPDHPLVMAVDMKIASLQKTLAQRAKAGAPEAQAVTQTKLQQNPEYQALQEQLTDANIAIQTQQAQQQHLQQTVAQYEQRIQAIPAQQKALTEKTRDYSILKAQYESLLKQREDLTVKAQLDRVTGSSSLTPIGYVYAQPTTGKTKMLVMLFGSLLLGVVIGIVMIVLAEWSDHSLRYEDATERLLGVPVLALLPETATLRVAPAGAAQALTPPSRRALTGAGEREGS